MDFKFCLLSAGRPPCSDRQHAVRMRASLIRWILLLSESHSFQANTNDDGGDQDRENCGKTPVTQSTEIPIFKLKLFRDYCIF